MGNWTFNKIFDPATKSKKKQGFRDPDVPIATKKEQNSGVRNSLDPSSNGVDEEISSDENIETAAESTVDSSGKSSCRFLLCFFITCVVDVMILSI